MRECLRQQPIGEPWVAGEERAVQVGPDRAPDAAPLESRLAVVAEPGDHPAERFRARIEHRPAGMVLEPGERSRLAGLELALE